ncbi:MAG: hypothetical protein ACPMAG_07970 [Limisphaerales bacterium]
MKTNQENCLSSNCINPTTKYTLIAAICLIAGLVAGVSIIHQIYKHNEKKRIEIAREEVAKLFDIFSQKIEAKLQKIQPQITKLESDLSAYQYIEKPSDIKLGPYRAQLRKIKITLNDIENILDQAANDAGRLIDKHKVSVQDIFDESQKDKLSQLKKLYSELSQNLQFFEVQIEMTEQFKNQLEMAEARQQNRELIEQIKNVVKEIESIQKGQNEIIELVKSESHGTSKRDNENILAFAKMQNELAQTMILATAIQSQAANQPAVYSPPCVVDPYYANYNPPLVIGTHYKTVGERMGPSYGTPSAYRIYPVPYPYNPTYIPTYSVHRAGAYTIYNAGRRWR